MEMVSENVCQDVLRTQTCVLLISSVTETISANLNANPRAAAPKAKTAPSTILRVSCPQPTHQIQTLPAVNTAPQILMELKQENVKKDVIIVTISAQKTTKYVAPIMNAPCREGLCSVQSRSPPRSARAAAMFQLTKAELQFNFSTTFSAHPLNALLMVWTLASWIILTIILPPLPPIWKETWTPWENATVQQ